jgi:hypothetical protein
MLDENRLCPGTTVRNLCQRDSFDTMEARSKCKLRAIRFLLMPIETKEVSSKPFSQAAGR